MVGDTQVGIVNLALDHLAQKKITAINDTNSVQAVAANRAWTPALNEALRSYDWAFARVLVQLVESGTYDPSILNYSFAYVMPTDCLALRCVFSAYSKNTTLGEKYERVYDPATGEQLILTNLGGADATEAGYARYTHNVTDVEQWDSSFVSAFTYLLAAKMAKNLISIDAKEIEFMIKLFNNSISEAQRLDSYEGEKDTDTGNPLVDSRQ